MKPVMIVERNQNAPLLIKEDAEAGIKKKDYVLGGIFTEFDVRNRNERIYTAPKFLPCLDELNERLTSFGVVYGEFDHPDVFDTSLQKSSHVIRKAFYNESANRVDGEIRLLSTHWGKEAKAIVDDGLPLFVSSRAAGVTESDGSVHLKKLFTYDIVADPGFASAKMSCINESVGFSMESNFRIYEMSNEQKINDLINMQNNEFVSKVAMSEYSKYLIKEINKTRHMVKESIQKGTLEPKKLEELCSYYEELQAANTKVIKYLDYLADQLTIVVNENASLKSTTDKLIKHNDYLAENLEKSIKYSEYVAEHVDKGIEYSNYIAEHLEKNIKYSEYIAENVSKNIKYSEYIAEHVDKGIAYSEYIAEHLDKNIAYSEYIAEHVDSNIAYAEYIAEHLDTNIAYSEYIAENLSDSIAYADYIAERLDGSVNYTKMIAEKLNSTNKLNESLGADCSMPMPEDAGLNKVENEEENQVTAPVAGETTTDAEGAQTDDVAEIEQNSTVTENNTVIEGENKIAKISDSIDNKIVESTELSSKIDSLIAEAKKRKASETHEFHFLKFMTKSQIDDFYALAESDREKIVLYINENKAYYSTNDVLTLMNEALAVKEETLEERVLRLIPESTKVIFDQLSETEKVAILNQARLHPNLTSDLAVEHFWSTRNLKKNEVKSVNEGIVNDEISNEQLDAILSRIKSIK